MIDRELPDDVEMQGASAGMRFRTVSSTDPSPLSLADRFRMADHPLRKPANGESRLKGIRAQKGDAVKGQIWLYPFGFAALSALCGEATAQQPSWGEQGSILACFYECKSDQGAPTWSEVTSLVLANLTPPGRDASLSILILDGNGNIIARTSTDIGSEDLDEINICRTLMSAGMPVPQAGLIEILVQRAVPPPPPPPPPAQPEIGVFAWVKDHLGNFLQDEDEPFSGRNSVKGIAKTECRVVPPDVITFEQLRNKIIETPQTLQIPPILIEGTGE